MFCNRFTYWSSLNVLLKLFFSDEFASVARWVTGKEVDPHIVELIYVLLDDNEDRMLSVKEFSPVLFQWRHSRGFHHQALGINLGRLRI